MGRAAGGNPGGIAGLAALIGEHTAAVRRDLHAYHRVRLSDIGRTVTWGEVGAFLAHLPPDAALWAVTNSPRQWRWIEHLLAASVHAAQSGNWQRGGGKGRRPRPIKPPGASEADETTVGQALPIDLARRLLDEWAGVDTDEDPVLLGPDGAPLTSGGDDGD